MTLTKYQRGEPMEGWNDCPSIMLPPASVPRGNKKRVKRVGLDINNTADRQVPTAINPGATLTTSGPPIRRPSGNITPMPYNRELSGSWVIISNTEKSPQVEKLQSFFSLPSSLPTEMLNMYQGKLQVTYPTLKDDDLIFINSIIDQTIALSLKDQDDAICSVDKMKTQILSYMMMNTDASTWCVPLKKVLEGISI